MPGGPVGPASRWAATSNVEVGQTTYLVNRGRVKKDGGEGSEGQSHEKKREGGSGTGEEPLARKGGLYLNICAEVPRYTTADEVGLPTYQGLV